MGKHRLYLQDAYAPEFSEHETSDPVVYLDAYRGWVREVPGSWVWPFVWYRTESVL
jgi:hypothetical protein